MVTDPGGSSGVRMRIRNLGGRGYYTLELWKLDPNGMKRRLLRQVTETDAAPGLDVVHTNYLSEQEPDWVVAYSREPAAPEPSRTACARVDGTPGCPGDLPDRPTVHSVLVVPLAAVLEEGDSVLYQAHAYDQEGAEIDGRPVVWSTPSPSVVSVDDRGMVRALAKGYGQVEATIDGVLGAAALTVTEGLEPLDVAPIDLPAATQGRDYAAQLVATGGEGTYGWSVQSGTLPSGMALAVGGALTGTPRDGGTFTFTVRVTDGTGRVATRPLPLTVRQAPTVQTTSLPPAEIGAPYTAQLTATGGTGGYTWSVISGTLPAGLTLSTSGDVSGTPTTEGSASFTVQVVDEASATHTRAFTVVVADVGELVSGVPVTGLAGEAGSVRYYGIDVPTGTTQLTFSISGGTGDVDLYVRHDALPQELVYDCRPLRQGNEETCARTDPDTGRWYIMLRGYVTYAGVTLTATVTQD
jgi:hypothetical protein